MVRSGRRTPETGLLAAAAAALLAGCSPGASTGQSQTVEGLKLDYGLAPAAAPGSPPASHPDPGMHGGPPVHRDGYHLVLSVREASSGRPADVTEAAVALTGPGHPGKAATPMEPMTVNGQPGFGRYVVLAEPGTYRLEFKVTPAGGHRPVTAKFQLQRPS